MYQGVEFKNGELGQI